VIHTVRPTPAACAAAGGSVYFGVPTVWSRLTADASSARALAGARLLVSGSAALPVRVFDSLRALTGLAPVERYGMSETLITLSTRADGERRPGWVGQPSPGVHTRLRDEHGVQVPADGRSIGELQLRTPTLFDSDLNRPEATAASWTVDGWLRTGDVAVIEPTGFHRIVGRKSTDLGDASSRTWWAPSSTEWTCLGSRPRRCPCTSALGGSGSLMTCPGTPWARCKRSSSAGTGVVEPIPWGKQLVSRPPQEAPRLAYERGLGLLDGVAGQLLGDHRTAERGAALQDRADALSRAVTLEENAQRKRAQADEQLERERGQAAKDRAAAQQEHQQAVAETRATEQERKRTLAQQAQTRAKAATKQADEKAAGQAKAVEDAERAEQSRVTAQEKAAAQPATAELKDAAQKQTDAAEQRADADGVEELAKAEQQERREQSAARRD